VVAMTIAPVPSIARKQAPNCRCPSKRMSIIGSSWFNSQITTATRQKHAVRAKATITFDPNQSLRWPSSSTNSSEPSPTATSAKPT
jgi:hypothetical protein